MGHRVKRPSGDFTVIRGNWATLAAPRVADVVRRLQVVVVAPVMFVGKSWGLDLKAFASPMRGKLSASIDSQILDTPEKSMKNCEGWISSPSHSLLRCD